MSKSKSLQKWMQAIISSARIHVQLIRQVMSYVLECILVGHGKVARVITKSDAVPKKVYVVSRHYT